MKETRLLIIGGGCAGLSLARRLAKTGSEGPDSFTAIVVEPRIEYLDDRTWCFWSGQNLDDGHLPLTSWSRVSVKNDETTVALTAGQHRYQMRRSIDFYREAIADIESGIGVELLLGTSALSSRKLPSGLWETETSGGTIISEWVVDTRPFLDVNSEPVLWQSFVGFEIETPQSVFDPEVAQLMSFRPGSVDGIDFVYVLPTTSNRALVEFTTISAICAAPSNLTKKLIAEIERISEGIPYRVLRKEQGRIPMGLPARDGAQPSTYVRAGVTAGSARPSSGYTFCRIQRWADACVRSLMAGGPPIGPQTDPPLVRFMDSIFLRVLERHPLLGPDLFVALFQRVPTSRLLRFLNDSPSILDAIFLIAALPKWPFLMACFQSAPIIHQPQRKSTCRP